MAFDWPFRMPLLLLSVRNLARLLPMRIEKQFFY